MADAYQQYDQALLAEAAAVKSAAAFDAQGAQQHNWLNPQPEREAAERWAEASAAASVLRSIEETHGGAFALSGRDTNQSLLSAFGVTGSASLRAWSEGKFAQASAERAAQKEALAADPLGGGVIRPRPDGRVDPSGWHDPSGRGGRQAPAPSDPGATAIEPSALGWLAAALGVAYLAWRFMR